MLNFRLALTGVDYCAETLAAQSRVVMRVFYHSFQGLSKLGKTSSNCRHLIGPVGQKQLSLGYLLFLHSGLLCALGMDMQTE